MSNLPPPRFREKSVERFRDAIIAIATSYPQPLVVHPAPLAKETFRSRFRDALKAIVKYGVCPDLLPYAAKMYDDIRVQEHGEEALVIGHREHMSSNVTYGSVGRIVDGFVNTSTLSDEVTPTQKIVLAAITLIEAGFLSDATFKAPADMIQQFLPPESPLTIMEKDGRTTIF